MNKTYSSLQKYIVTAVFCLCTCPFLLNLLGFNFGITNQLNLLPGETTKQAINQNAGAVFHIIMEWSAVTIATLTAIASFMHFYIRRQVTVPIIGMALLCAGIVDAFHILAANKIIETETSYTDFIPFTWALSRIFNASILITGAAIGLWILKIQPYQTAEKFNKRSTFYLPVIGTVFFFLVFISICLTATHPSLPQTNYENALVSRPFDILPLGLYFLSASLFWVGYKRTQSTLWFTLLLSCLPAVATQLHMAFGAHTLYDNDFNIAHGLKIIAYGVIFLGVLIDIFFYTSLKQPSPSKHENTFSENNIGKERLALGKVKKPLGLLIPITGFVLTSTVSLIVAVIFYLENEKLLIQKQLDALKNQSLIIEPRLVDLYQTATNDALFLSRAPIINQVINVYDSSTSETKRQWRKKVENEFSNFLVSKPLYNQIRLIGTNKKGKEIVSVVKRNNAILNVPETQLSEKGNRVYFHKSIRKLRGEVYFSKVELARKDGLIIEPHQPVLRVATPVYNENKGELFGIVVISIRFDWFVERLVKSIPHDTELILTNNSGGYLYHLDIKKQFAFNQNRDDAIQLDFPKIREILGQEKNLPLQTLLNYTGQEYVAHLRNISLSEFDNEHSLNLLLYRDKNLLIDQLTRFRNRSIMLGIALSLLALALSIVATRRVSEPITQMTDAIKQYEVSGKIGELPVETGNEIGLCARSFHNLIQRIDSALEEQEETSNYLSAIMNSVVDGIITIDHNGFVLSFNHAAERIFGYRETEIIGRPITVLMPPDMAKHHQKFINAYLKTGTSKIIGKGRELTGIRKSGENFPLHLSIAEVTAIEGTVFSGIIRDISQQKFLEEEKHTALQKAEESAKLKSEFLASMSHEIRTPMNGVLGMLGLLKKDGLNERQYHKVKLAYNSAQALLSLINDILDFSKIEAKKLEVEIVDYDLPSLLGDFAESIAPKAQDKGLELILDIRNIHKSMVKGDPGRLRQILNNLVGNAIKFTSQGNIIIQASLTQIDKQHLNLTCSVIDSGPGIAVDKQAQIFDSFTQEDASTTRKFGGTGLGLAIVKQLCMLMHGDISVFSEPGEGSTFQFNIMLEKSEDEHSTLPTSNTKNLNVLVVDGNRASRESLKAQLEMWHIHSNEASNAEIALILMSKMHYDLVFIDQHLPDAKGLILIERIRNQAAYDSVKLVLMTTIENRPEPDKKIKKGISLGITKPVTLEDLHTALRLIHEPQNIDQQHQKEKTNNNEPTAIEFPSNLRLLLVEDNAINQEVIKGILEDYNLQCDFSGNGYEALEALKSSEKDYPYHLILMDCQMPEMDGFEATLAIRSGRAGECYVDIPIVAMTANAMKGDRERCLESGMNDYLAKPVDTQELETTLAKWLLAPDSGYMIEHSNLIHLDDKKNQDIWDEAAFLKRLRGKSERAVKLITTFLDSIPQEVEDLIQHIEQGQFQESAFSAHSIKGVAKNISSEILAERMIEIEKACKTEDHESLKKISTTLIGIIDQVSTELIQYRDKHAETTSSHIH